MSNFYEKIRNGVSSFLEKPSISVDCKSFIIEEQQKEILALTQERNVLIYGLGRACRRLNELQNNAKESDPNFWIDISKKSNFN